MSTTVLIVFLLVYLGMFLGELPFLQIDRTGIALLGAIALVALGEVSPHEAAQSVHLPTLLLLFSFMVLSARGRWTLEGERQDAPPERREDDEAVFDPWQTAKGLMVAGALLVVFLFTDVPREVAALTGAGLLLLSRRLHTNKMLGLVDGERLVLFIGLFVVNHAFQETGLAARAMQTLAEAGFPLGSPLPMFAVAFVASNLVSNVPAVMLLLPAATEPWSGPLLALVSTLAGNLLIVGSIANIIVVDAAARRGIRIDWRMHARVGVPVTLATLAIAAAWLMLRFSA